MRAGIEQLRLTPVMFELGARPHPPRALYRSYLEQSDVFVGVYWQRYGWVAPDMDISGLEDELVLSAGMPRLVYVKRPAPEMEPRLEEMLGRLQDEDTTSYKPFGDAAELERLLVDDLALMLTERFDAGHEPVDTELSAPNTLPVPTTPLLGRAAILRDLDALLDKDDTRLVTLTGPGGTGKTRLAVEAAAARADRYRDGVFFVDLSSEHEPAGVFAAMARAVLTTGAGDRQPLEAIEHGVGDRQLLVVLDNFEQVISAAPGIAGLVQHCSGLTLLVTSREALRIRDERVLAVPPLSLPDPTSGNLAVEQALESPAVRLFVERAAATAPDFSITEENVADVAAVCERLDGLPLAIELAAARINLFAVDELRERLDRRLDVLQGGARDLPERQQTLRSAIEWSHDLLGDAERSVLRLFAAFSGARLADVEATARQVPALAGVDVVGVLGSLVDKSLVRSTRGLDGRPRFSMLQTIRDYATEQLESDADLAESVRQAHAEHYTYRAVELQQALNEGDRALGLSAMEAELGNVRTAWDRWVRTDDVDRLHELLEPLWGFHEARGDYTAAIELGDDLLGVLERQPATADRARDEYALHLNVARAIVAARGFTPDAERRMRAALEQSDTSTDPRRHFTTLRSLAVLHIMRTDFESAAAVARELLAIAQAEQDPTMLCDAHLVAGTTSVWLEGCDAALAHLDTSIRSHSTSAPTVAQFRLGPHPEVVSHAISGLVLWMVGLPERGLAHSAQALEIAAELGHPYSTAYALWHTTLLDLRRSDLATVAVKADELIRVAEAHDYAIWRALGIVVRGTAMVGLGEPDAGLTEVEIGFSQYQGLSTPQVFWPNLLMIRAQTFAMAGRLDDAIACMREADDVVDESDPVRADMKIALGDLLLGLPSPDVGAAQALFEGAASLAAARGSRMTQLEAITRLLDLARGTPQEASASDRLRAILDTFTEGFDEAPLVAARAALDRE